VEENKSGTWFTMIPAFVLYDNDLSAFARIFYGQITSLCNSKGFCWASNKHFAELFDINERSVRRYIAELHEAGYIYVEINREEQQQRKIYIVSPQDNSEFPRPLKRADKTVHPMPDEIVHPMPDKTDRPMPDEIVHPTPDKTDRHNNLISFNNKINNINNNKIYRSNTLENEVSTPSKKPKSLPSKQLSAEFEELWKLYPRKIGKKKAHDSYVKARKNDKTTYKTIQAGLYRYIQYLEHQETEEQFILHGSTWFNQEKWLDEYITTGFNRKPKNSTEYLRAKYGGDFFESGRNGEIVEHYTEVIPDIF
jgi:Helix-turn-helix domain